MIRSKGLVLVLACLVLGNTTAATVTVADTANDRWVCTAKGDCKKGNKTTKLSATGEGPNRDTAKSNAQLTLTTLCVTQNGGALSNVKYKCRKKKKSDVLDDFDSGLGGLY